LKASGLVYASLLLALGRIFGRKSASSRSPGFNPQVIPICRHKVLKKTATGFDISVPNYSPTALHPLTWFGHDLGESVLALLKNYTDPSKNVSGKSYPVVTANITYPDTVAMIAKGKSPL